MWILRMTMSHSQIHKKNNFQPDVQITTVYKNSSFQPGHYFLDRGFFILIINFFNHLFRIPDKRITRWKENYSKGTGLITESWSAT